MRAIITAIWPPARRRERARRARLTALRWDFWFHCLASRSLRDPEDDAWWSKFRALQAEIEAVSDPRLRSGKTGGDDA